MCSIDSYWYIISMSLSEVSSNLLLILACQRVGIPPNLVHCYRGNETQNWNANSLPLVIELIRKVEAFYPTSIDMRQLSVKLFHE